MPEPLGKVLSTTQDENGVTVHFELTDAGRKFCDAGRIEPPTIDRQQVPYYVDGRQENDTIEETEEICRGIIESTTEYYWEEIPDKLRIELAVWVTNLRQWHLTKDKE